MATARHVVGILKSSDGRIRIKILSGVSALIAVIALLVGVLPVFASHPSETVTVPGGIDPDPLQYGGGPGACDFVGSDARFELHINNPRPGDYSDPETGTTVNIEVNNRTFRFTMGAGVAAYDVVVNGGAHNLHYDYDATVDGPRSFDGDGTPTGNLHAPKKSNGDFNNLSHINICYDVAPTLFECGPDEVHAVKFGELGLFTDATAQVFTVDGQTECSKLGLFFIDDGETTLDFGTGNVVVTGRADFHKQFDLSVDNFEALKYDGPGELVFLEWCDTRAETVDDLVGDPAVNPFADVLPTGKYPSLDGVVDVLADDSEDATACKVAEIENAAGVQHTVVYFEFEDPNFR